MNNVDNLNRNVDLVVMTSKGMITLQRVAWVGWYPPLRIVKGNKTLLYDYLTGRFVDRKDAENYLKTVSLA